MLGKRVLGIMPKEPSFYIAMVGSSIIKVLIFCHGIPAEWITYLVLEMWLKFYGFQSPNPLAKYNFRYVCNVY